MLVHQFEDEDLETMEILDFSLPEEVTNYVICVSFDPKGEVVDISMES